MDYNLRRQQLVFVHLLPNKKYKSIKYQVLVKPQFMVVTFVLHVNKCPIENPTFTPQNEIPIE